MLSVNVRDCMDCYWQMLFKKNVANDKLRESIGGALGAVVNTYRRMPGRATHQVCSSSCVKCAGLVMEHF